MTTPSIPRNPAADAAAAAHVADPSSPADNTVTDGVPSAQSVEERDDIDTLDNDTSSDDFSDEDEDNHDDGSSSDDDSDSDDDDGSEPDVAPGDHRAGLVAVVGRPNVGKSTLVNALVGYKVSIVSAKPQTTRHRILGIDTQPSGQIVYVDTPGLHTDSKRAINRHMNRAARGSLTDVQLGLLVVEAGQWRDEDEAAFAVLRDSGLPRALVINKVDKIKDKAELLPYIAQVTQDRGFSEVFPVSAEKGVGLADLRRRTLALLPESPPLFGEDEVTDRSERFLVTELIREQLMRQLGAELPYAAAVALESYKEEQLGNKAPMLRIAATIWVERASQKAIVIGAGGARIRAVGQSARLAIEKQFERKVFLELWCKVRDGWSDDEASLRGFGYSA